MSADKAVEVDTPNGAITVMQPGDLRLDVYTNGGGTLVTVDAGAIQVIGPGVEKILGAGESVHLLGSNPIQALEQRMPGKDPFDVWSQQRDRVFLGSDACICELKRLGRRIWTRMGSGRTRWNMDRCGIRRIFRQVGRRIRMASGAGSRRGDGLGWIGCMGIRAIPLWAVDRSRVALGMDSRAFGCEPGIRAGDGCVRRGCKFSNEAGAALSGWIPLGAGEPFYPAYACSAACFKEVNLLNLSEARSNPRRIPASSYYTYYHSRAGFRSIHYAQQKAATIAVPSSVLASGEAIAPETVVIPPRCNGPLRASFRILWLLLR